MRHRESDPRGLLRSAWHDWLRSPPRVRLGLLGVFLAYSTFIVAPIVARLRAGYAFGGDLAEYLLAARQDLSPGPATFHYLFPVLPAAYVPLVAASPGYVSTYAIGDLVSGLLAVGLFAASGVLGYALTRTGWGATASAVTVGTFFLVLNEIGWGGQAQALAFSLGLLALSYLFWEVVPSTGSRAPLVAGVLLGVGALTESYATAYFVTVSLAWCVLSEGRALFSRRCLRAYWPIAVFPLASLGVVTAAGGSAAASVATDPILPHALTLGAWSTALSDLNFGNVIDLYSALAIAAALLLFAVVGVRWRRRFAVAIGAASIAVAVQVFLLTPAVYWDRAPYFLVFPLALASASIVSPGVVALVRSRPTEGSARPAAGRFRRRRWADVACAVVVVGALIAQSGIAVDQYPRVLRFYSVDSAALSELGWLRDQTGGLLMVAPEGLTFPVAYATGRPLFPWTQPYWFDTYSEQQATILASELVAGHQWITAGSLTLANTSAPSNSSSPGVFAYRFPYFVKLFDVSETQGLLPGVALARSMSAPEPPASTSSGLAPLTVSPSFASVDLLTNYTVTKTSGAYANGSVMVQVEFASDSTNLAPVTLTVGMPQGVPADVRVGSDGGTVRQLFAQPGSTTQRFLSTIMLRSTPNVTVASPTVIRAGAESSISWQIFPGAGFTGRMMIVDLQLQVQGIPTGAPQLIDEASAMATHSIRWVVLSVVGEPGLRGRFENDPAFSLYWTSPDYWVFAVP